MLGKYSLLVCMREIFTNPLKKYSVRGLSKKTKLSVFACKQSLDYLYNNKLISLEKIGRTYQYRADTDNFLVRQWKIIFSLDDIYKACVVEKLLKNLKNISSIVIYGSVANGTDDENSDIDVLVVADTKDKKHAASLHLPRELNVLIYTPMEWRNKAHANKLFYEQVILNSIVLYGFKPVVL